MWGFCPSWCGNVSDWSMIRKCDLCAPLCEVIYNRSLLRRPVPPTVTPGNSTTAFLSTANKQTIERTNDKRRLFSPNCIIQGSSVTRMTSIGPASPSQNHTRTKKNGEIPLTRLLSRSLYNFMTGQVPGRPPSRPDF